ncbi:MAG TPA: acyl-CoA dehydrogenase [Acidimicrobiales bacterium]|nr:acyl-CoA dehydrogenase [Acidimicrobiales bacterium]
MPIGIGEDHEELRRTVRRWIESYCGPEVPRGLLDADKEPLPPFWDALAEQGWLGLHVGEEEGGQGFGFAELAVVVEELGRAAAPGPVVTTMLAAAVAATAAPGEARSRVLRELADGSAPAAVALPGSGTLDGRLDDGGTLQVTGTLRPVLGVVPARLLLAPVCVEGGGSRSPWAAETDAPTAGAPTATAGRVRWCAVDLGASGVEVDPIDSFDPTRRVGTVRLASVAVPADAQLPGVDALRVVDLALVVAAAECAGGARWCLEVGTQHAIERRQFGRPIGQFQAVKHRLADMLVSVEQVTALAWDAASAADGADTDVAALRLTAALAGSVVLDAYVECAKACIQILGGMGFTWEHDAHIHLRRSIALRQVLGGSAAPRLGAARAALGGSRRALGTELPEEAEALRAELRPLVEQVAAAGKGNRRKAMVEAGLLAPHWPKPHGRDAGPVEQLVIDQEFAAVDVPRPNLAVGAWALPTIIAHGTEAQQERFVLPTLLGDLVWCQLFSEPGAGSDLAALATRAERVEGGWVLNGQKVWTSVAQRADFGICLARTDPDAAKHAGITYFLVDMRTPGIEVRPLREITGDALFNEVFLTDVFVPDDCVVGDVNGGWRLARTTLANERVSMSSGMTFGWGIEAILGWLGARPAMAEDPVTLDRLGALLAEAQSLAVLGQRTTLRSVSGVEPGPEASVRKLLGAEHEQRVQEFGLALLGPEGATTEGDAAIWSRGFLSTRCLTIAGGTSEVQRNVIAERLLGLPRDPEPAGPAAGS